MKLLVLNGMNKTKKEKIIEMVALANGMILNGDDTNFPFQEQEIADGQAALLRSSPLWMINLFETRRWIQNYRIYRK